MATAYLFLILAPIMVAVNIVGAKHLIATLPLVYLLTFRFLLAALLLLPLHWFTQASKQRSLSDYLRMLNHRDWLFLMVQALCAGVLFNALMVMGLRYTDANVAGIITSALPAIIALLSWPVLKEKFTPKKLLCIGFATAGLIVINAQQGAMTHAHPSFIGNGIVFLSLLPEAAYYVFTQLHPCRLPIFLMSALINGINTLVMLPWLWIYSQGQALQIAGLDGFILILIGISSGLFYVCWHLGSVRVDPMMAALSTAIMPIATVLIAWLILGETIGWLQALGVGLVILSILAYALPSHWAKKMRVPPPDVTLN